ncbi:MAG: hypothetical protein HFG92_03270 [Dorea sp.]|jgi:hypothetical protein|nr:hypothetical protein [Dorea sp.]
MSVAVSIISTIIKSAVNNKVGNELANELIGISVDDVSEKGINKINDFINNGKSKIENILSEEKMKSMNISEDNIAYIIAEIKRFFFEIEITDDIFRQCKFDSLNLCRFLWEKYSENKTYYIECESDIKKSLLAISETLIIIMCESEEFVRDISIQISNTVDDTRIGIRRMSAYLEENFGKISANNQRNYDILRKMLEQNQKKIKESNITQEEKFQNNKKDKYLEIWNSILFLHMDENEKDLTLKDVFIMPKYVSYKVDSNIYNYGKEMQKIVDKDSIEKEKETKLDVNTIGIEIKKFVEYKGTSSMLITGVPGIGKTSMVSWIANEFKDNNNIIILRFRDWESEELNNRLLKIICNTLQCVKRDLENKILVLDGFDEVKLLLDREKLLYDFLNDILDLDNFKIVITSRPNYIDFNSFKFVFELLPFEIIEIKHFYKLIKGVDLKDEKKVYDNLDVIGIPVILYMAIMSNIDFTKEATKPELYNCIFTESGGIFDKFAYKGNGYDNGTQILRDKKNIKKYIKFLRDISFIMFEENTLMLSKYEYVMPKLNFQDHYVNILDFPIKYLFENTGHYVEFVHKSIYEYFISEYIFDLIYNTIKINKIDKLSGVMGDIFKKNLLSLEILDFLKYRIKNSMLNDKYVMIEDAFQLMLQYGMMYFTGKCIKNVIECEMNIFRNMLEFLHLWEGYRLDINNLICKYLRYNVKPGLNLKNIDLRNKNLSGVNLFRADLSGAYLSYSYLKDANLEEINLEGAVLSNIDIRGANLTKINFVNTTLENILMENAKISKTIFSKAQISYLEQIYKFQGDIITTSNFFKVLHSIRSKRKIFSSKEKNKGVLLQNEIDLLVEVMNEEFCKSKEE